MDGKLKRKSLAQKLLLSFVGCIAVLLLLALPLFYFLTESFYAEDMINIIQAVNKGNLSLRLILKKI